MERFYVFIANNGMWFMVLCGLGVIWYIIQFAKRQRELQRSSFYLERDRALLDRSTAVRMLLFFSLIMAGITYINRQIVPTLPAEVFVPPTATPDIFLTALATPEQLLEPTRFSFPTATPLIAATATLADPNSAESKLPPTPDISVDIFVEGCEDGAVISEPVSGSTITGGVSIFGRATDANFSYYKIEINGPFTNNQWQSLLDGVVNAPVDDKFLGSANLTYWTSGSYQVRLTVVDTESNEVASCLIQVAIIN